jgi:hypothetical protein
MNATLKVFVVVLLLTGSARAQEADAVAQAGQAAKSWLDIVDQEKYGQSWDEAAALFKGAVTREFWEEAVRSARAPLGALKSRTVKTATFTRNLPGAPAGEYVVVQFDTQFANRSAVETVTPMREKDGSWKVSGYFVK